MIHSILSLLQVVSVIGSLSALGYYLVCLWSARAFLQDSREQLKEQSSLGFQLPPVSILKPLKGIDPEIYESFRSHCDQDYPEDYEIIFGVSEENDPALDVVKRLQLEFPQRRIELIVCTERLGVNIKVSNLVQMARTARYDCFVVNDSDIRVDHAYLRRAMAHLSDPDVGLVTCLYRAAAESLGRDMADNGIALIRRQASPFNGNGARGSNSNAQRFSMKKFAIIAGAFNRVTKRVTEIETSALATFVALIFGDDFRFDLDISLDEPL